MNVECACETSISFCISFSHRRFDVFTMERLPVLHHLFISEFLLLSRFCKGRGEKGFSIFLSFCFSLTTLYHAMMWHRSVGTLNGIISWWKEPYANVFFSIAVILLLFLSKTPAVFKCSLLLIYIRCSFVLYNQMFCVFRLKYRHRWYYNWLTINIPSNFLLEAMA